jgi:alpha-ketoglutarate-dependent taurine dioxygenase
MSTITGPRVRIHPVSAAVGAEIQGVDLSQPIAPDTFGAIRDALFTHGVIFFRDQHLTPDQHVAFARRFGEINVNRFFKAVDGFPMIAEIRKDPGQEKNIGGNWHTDHSYDTAPAMGSILYARAVPDMGGDTFFASMYAAYDALSDGLKRTLEGLRALHSSRQAFGAGAYATRGDLNGRVGNADLATQDAIHPVVITHPGTGRKALYVNQAFTVRFDGWTDDESRPLLQYLYQHASRLEFTYRFQWRPGSIAFWDNRCTWHYALNDYQGQRRVMHRITVEGVPLG